MNAFEMVLTAVGIAGVIGIVYFYRHIVVPLIGMVVDVLCRLDDDEE